MNHSLVCLCVLQWKARTASFDSQGSCPSPRPPASPWAEPPVTQQPRRGFPPSCRSTSCLSDWGETQPHCLSLSLSFTVPPSLKSSPRALPRTDLGQPSSQLVVWSAVFSGFRGLKCGCCDDPELAGHPVCRRLIWSCPSWGGRVSCSHTEILQALKIQLCAAETLWWSDFAPWEQRKFHSGGHVRGRKTDLNWIWSNFKIWVRC